MTRNRWKIKIISKFYILHLSFIISNSFMLFTKFKFLYYNIKIIDYNQSEILSYLISFFSETMQKILYSKKIVFYSLYIFVVKIIFFFCKKSSDCRLYYNSTNTMYMWRASCAWKKVRRYKSTTRSGTVTRENQSEA